MSEPEHFRLGINNILTPSNIPSDETIVNAARELLESTGTWKQGKSYHKNTVKTFSRPKGPEDGAPWHSRVSEHTAEDATFQEFWNGLGVNKAEQEKEFIQEIKKVTLVKQVSPTQAIWTMYYTFAPPISPRIFTVLQTTYLPVSEQPGSWEGIIVSIPVDLTSDADLAKLEEKGVKGRYVSVERLKELDNGHVEWRMATSSTPGGRIPQFLAENSMASKISEDVPHFIHWWHQKRKAQPAEAAAPAEQSAPAGES